MIELARVLAGRAGLSEREWDHRVRLAYAKVAEFQSRGLVHFHAIVRLDGAEDRATAPGVAVSPEELCDAIRQAAHRARLDGAARDGQTTDMRFGEQLHTRVLTGAEICTARGQPRGPLGQARGAPRAAPPQARSPTQAALSASTHVSSPPRSTPAARSANSRLASTF
jgi:hypothetical protein